VSQGNPLLKKILIGIGVIAVVSAYFNAGPDSGPAADPPVEKNARQLATEWVMARSKSEAQMSDADVLRYDSLVHAFKIPVADSQTHVRASTLRQQQAASLLASAKRLMSDSAPVATIRRAINVVPDSLLSAGQRTEKQALERRLAARAGRERAADERRAREMYARAYESRLLDDGLNVDVTTSGTGSTILKLKWILVSKVIAHQVAKGDLLTELRAMGFKRFVITDGYDETWYWDLSK
jgi:hypothetical protein